MNTTFDTALTWIREGRADLPQPGAGRTWERWSGLMALSREDLAAGRIVEAHADAQAICKDLGLGADDERDSLWAVWAAEPPTPQVVATRCGQRWFLSGTKPWCSAATHATHALVTARDEGTPRLFRVALQQRGVTPKQTAWAGAGMASTDTGEVEFDQVAAEPVGTQESYLCRAGFWHGGIGVAACWWGGAQGLLEIFGRSLAGRSDPHALAHLGACLAWDEVITGALRSAATQIDAAAQVDTDSEAGQDSFRVARRRALAIRSMVDRACTEVIERFGRALGASPWAKDAAAATRIQDLQVYVRQNHAERDEAELAHLALIERAIDAGGL